MTFTLNGTETCTGETDATGTASCSITPGEPAATYTLTGSFGGDTTQPLQLTGSSGSANFVVTLEETELSYTGGTVAQNGQPLTVSGVLTSDDGATPTRRPAGDIHVGQRLHGADLRRHHVCERLGLVHHRSGQPAAGPDPRH